MYVAAGPEEDDDPNAICASVNFDAFMELSSSCRGIIRGKFQFKLD